MSSDGAIDKPRSVRPARGDDRGVAGIALGVLLLLALVATVVMVFSDDPVWMRIGTLSALWAAFIGAFLVARYRRQASAEAARVRDLHTVYELQLEREISARREHELVVEKDLRDTVRAETSDSIQALRHEIAALREQLGQMGMPLTDDRPAVGGDTTAGELGAGSSLPSVRSERVEPRRRAPESTFSASAGPSSDPRESWTTPGPARPRQSTPEPTVTGVGRHVTPSTERTEKISAVDTGQTPPDQTRPDQTRPDQTRPDQTRSAEARGERSRGPAVRPAGRTQPEPRTRPDAPKQPAPATTPEGPKRSAPASEPATAEPATAEPVFTEPPAQESATSSRHGEGGGLSVADLMARLGEDAPSGGRRRRHSAD
ncbi:DUF6779 domain-containing protein [Dietzia sp. PP-33]|uniref:DUF6779 domain-containing protein n=1 Tax=Dietzia sp. PP-33 TaxID=2957500 RepID=UPI0029B96C9E|nr:DUF6779 domain-containing protein [Dietzia sp. PP-33]MDX2357037.1 hypothetical protein [Dietzia sp. PP-33]